MVPGDGCQDPKLHVSHGYHNLSGPIHGDAANPLKNNSDYNNFLLTYNIHQPPIRAYKQPSAQGVILEVTGMTGVIANLGVPLLFAFVRYTRLTSFRLLVSTTHFPQDRACGKRSSILPANKSKDANLLGIWNVFDKYWGGEEQPRPAPPAAPADAAHAPSADASEAAGDVSGGGPAPEQDAPAVGNPPVLSDDGSAFAAYDEVPLGDLEKDAIVDDDDNAMLDDYDGEPLEDGPEPPSTPTSSVPALSESNPTGGSNGIDPRSQEELKEELTARVAKLRRALWKIYYIYYTSLIYHLVL